MSELASLLSVDPPNLTAVVDDLGARGARRAPGSSHRPAGEARRGLTGKAPRSARKADEILARPPASLRSLPAEDLEGLVRILAKLHADPTPDF